MATRSRVLKPKKRLQLFLEVPFEDAPKLTVEGVSVKSKVSTLKTRLEQDAGLIPWTYHLSYLDTAPMEDHSTLIEHDIINGATLQVHLWRIWIDLLTAAYSGDVEECFLCSMSITGDSEWIKKCAWTTLYTAVHRGHHILVAELLKRTSLAINTQSSCGWTVLHAAARKGHWKVLCILLDNGSDVRITDNKGRTAFDLSRKHGHKKCENSLNFSQWNLQKDVIVKERKYDYDAAKARRAATRCTHQYKDSRLTGWLSGPRGHLYMAHTPNPVTVKVVAQHKEKEKVRKSSQASSSETCSIEEERDPSKKLEFNYGWFDSVRAQQLIPCTHDILTYTDPSSCQLRPRTVLNPGGYKTQLYVPPATAKAKEGGAGL